MKLLAYIFAMLLPNTEAEQVEPILILIKVGLMAGATRLIRSNGTKIGKMLPRFPVKRITPSPAY